MKDNQPGLLRDISQEFLAADAAFPPPAQRERQRERQEVRTVDKGHGRLEVWTLTSTTALNGYLRWPAAWQVLRVVCETVREEKRTREVRYFSRRGIS